MKNICLSNKSSFTLLENIISLFIISTMLILMIPCLTIMRKNIQQNNETVNFYSYLSVIESDSFNFRYVNGDNDKITLYNINNKKTYYIKVMNNNIVMSTIRGGYVPIMQNVKTVKWFYDDKHHALSTELITTDDQLFNSKSRFIKN